MALCFFLISEILDNSLFTLNLPHLKQIQTHQQNVTKTSKKHIGTNTLQKQIAINQQNLEKSHLVFCRDWINKLHKRNNDKMIYPKEKFSKTLCDMWSDLCFSSTRFGIWTFQLFFSANLINYKYLFHHYYNYSNLIFLNTRLALI